MTNSTNISTLFFWHFFQRIEKELSYERWIDKYKLFLTTLESGVIPYESNHASFKRFCKILYLQDIRHEKRFEKILEEAIQKERDLLMVKLNQTQIKNTDSSTKKKGEPKSIVEPTDSTPTPTSTKLPENPTEIPIHQPQNKTETLFFHPKIKELSEDIIDEEKANSRFEQFLHWDEYFPITRRDMVKTWQYLRRREVGGTKREMDIPRTIEKVAKSGLFLQPVFQKGWVNRKDTLIIFADIRGSMMPFHSLVRRLILTAKGEGGHAAAKAYYFQDYPASFVYEEADLSKPIPLKAALQITNRQATTAIIISDAGASRGGVSESRRVERSKNIDPFLKILNNCTAQILWLNPMPRHRWVDTSAELIADKVTAMIPILEEKDFDFQNTIRLILKQRLL